MLFRADPWLHVIAGCMSSGKTDELLRLLRRAEIAKESQMPAYVVAHDRTLVDMARKKPRTREALLSVHGMGPSRVEHYGERFLSVLAEG